jgi:uncharacterized protein (TIGR02246 family)
MRLAVTVLVVGILVAPVLAQSPAGSAEHQAAATKVLQEWDAARNKGDWKAFSNFYTPDATSLSSDGSWRRGRQEIEKGIAELWSKTYKGVTYRTIVEAVYSFGADVMLADATFEMSNIPGGGTRKGRVSIVLVNDGGWRIAATRNMVPVPAGAVRTGS